MKLSLAALLLTIPTAFAAEPSSWTTYRGYAQRTGNTEGKPGPDKPGVLSAALRGR